MMRHVSEYYIKYLLADQGAGQPVEWFVRQLAALGLPPVTSEQLNSIRTSFQAPAVFQPRNLLDTASVSFLRREKIYGLFHPDKFTQGAWDILHNRLVRDKVEALLLGRHSDLSTARLVEKTTKEKVSPKSVGLYRHYFFNVDSLSAEELAQQLYQHTTDWTMKSSALRGGPDVAAFRIGIQRRLDSRDILLKAQSILYHKMLEADRLRLDLENVEMLTKLVKGIVEVDGRLAQGDVAIKEVLEKFKEFRISHAKEDRVIGVNRLTKGRHSGAGSPVDDIISVDEDE